LFAYSLPIHLVKGAIHVLAVVNNLPDFIYQFLCHERKPDLRVNTSADNVTVVNVTAVAPKTSPRFVMTIMTAEPEEKFKASKLNVQAFSRRELWIDPAIVCFD